jgi:hypothetical protein
LLYDRRNSSSAADLELVFNMSFYRDLLRVSEANRIEADHIEFQLDLEEVETEFGPTTLPRRILKDRESPLESMRPVEFRMTFGMSKDGFRRILDMIHDQGRHSPNYSYYSFSHKDTFFKKGYNKNGLYGIFWI